MTSLYGPKDLYFAKVRTADAENALAYVRASSPNRAVDLLRGSELAIMEEPVAVDQNDTQHQLLGQFAWEYPVVLIGSQVLVAEPSMTRPFGMVLFTVGTLHWRADKPHVEVTHEKGVRARRRTKNRVKRDRRVLGRAKALARAFGEDYATIAPLRQHWWLFTAYCIGHRPDTSRSDDQLSFAVQLSRVDTMADGAQGYIQGFLDLPRRRQDQFLQLAHQWKKAYV